MLAALAAVAAATGSCPSHSVPAPADAPFDTRCAWTAEASSSVFACVEKCAADGGVPACPNSTAEYAWLAETIVDRASVEAVKESFRAFRGEQAECFLAADRHKLLGVIEASFGDFHEFDHLVRNVFEMRRSRTERFSVDLTSESV